jgi:hypothetical protein
MTAEALRRLAAPIADHVWSIEEIVSLRGKVSCTVELFSENSSGRFPMTVGTTYVVFAYRALGRTMVDSCGNSGPLPEKAEARGERSRSAARRG